MSYAIRNRRTKKFVRGTDYRYHPPHQITSECSGFVYENYEEAMMDLRSRRCGAEYEVIPVKIIEEDENE